MRFFAPCLGVHRGALLLAASSVSVLAIDTAVAHPRIPPAFGPAIIHHVGKKKAVDAELPTYVKPVQAQPEDEGDPEGKPAFNAALAKAQAGDVEAMQELAGFYDRGWGVGKSGKEARAWTKKRFDTFVARAERGDIDALWHVANSYEYGNNGVEVDPAKAALWSKKRFDIFVARAEAGDNEALWEVANSFENGNNGVEVDPAKAAYWQKRYRETVLKQAQSGDAKAMMTLATMMRDGGTDDGARDYAGALVWVQKAASLGNREAMVALAESYDEGIDVPADRVQAFAWYLKADAVAGTDPWNERRVLAEKYKTGDGTAKNLVEAARLHVEVIEKSGGWRKRMRAENYADDVLRSELEYRRAVQKELADRGLYTGPIDGIVSPAVVDAIKAVWRRKVKDE